jgi:hypothetical protein
MDEAIYTLLKAIIPETYPVQAPKGQAMPYCIYTSERLKEHRSLSQYLGYMEQTFEVDIITSSVKSTNEKFILVRNALKAIEQTTVTKYIQAVSIDENAPMLYESEINGYRKILTFTLIYQN